MRAGDLIFVSGCTAMGPDGAVTGGDSMLEQACAALAAVAAATMVEVAALIDSRLLVEVEATAYRSARSPKGA